MGHVLARAEPTPSERVVARERFEEGVSLEAKGDWEGALARFSDVARVVTTPNVHFHLGLCFEHTSRLVRALDEFERSLALQNLATKPDPVMTKSAEEHIASLRKRIPVVELRLPPDVPSQPPPVVTIDGVTLTLVPRQIPLDPGPHEIVVRVHGRPPFERRLVLEEGRPASIDVVFEGSAPPGESPPALDVKHRAEMPSSTKAPEPAPSASEARPFRSWAFVAAGTAVTALLAGGTMFVLRGSVISDLDAACGDDRGACPPSQRDLVDRGVTYTTLGNVFVGVGSVAAVSSLVLFLVDAGSARPRHASLVRGIGFGAATGAPFALTFRRQF